MNKVLFLIVFFVPVLINAQNVGIGTPTPTEKLEVTGNIKAGGLKLSTGGSAYDFLMQTNSSGQVGVKKGHGALALHYIIATDPGFAFPSSNPPLVNTTYLGEIKIIAGNFPPYGWMFCEGQILTIIGNQPLFALMGTTYGGDGRTNFALPDLRGAVPVHTGTSPAGYSWTWGLRTN